MWKFFLTLVHLSHFTLILSKSLQLSGDEFRTLISAADPAVSPGYSSDKPVHVEISIDILNVRSIEECDMTVTLDLILQKRWHDGRLKIPDYMTSNDKIIIRDESLRIWTPHTYFRLSTGGKKLSFQDPSAYFYIEKNASVTMLSRLTVVLTCEMDFKYYPHDTQLCNIDLRSFSDTKDVVNLSWRKLRLTKRLKRDNHLLLPEFSVNIINRIDCTRIYEEGVFSCVRGVLSLQRHSEHYALQYYIPSLLIVLTTFVGFHLPITAYPARVALVITSLLSLITMQTILNNRINASYIVAINIWMFNAIAFVFSSLIEYAIAIRFAEKFDIDRVSRYLFPSAFAITIFIYPLCVMDFI